MSTRSLITLSLEELDCIQEQCRRLGERAKASASVFTLDEMQAIRDQYEARLRVEAARREDMEWRLEVALEHLRTTDPVEEVDQRPLYRAPQAQATPPHGLRITGRQPRTSPPPLPARARLGSDGGDRPELPSPINLAPLRDALLRVAGRRDDRARA